MSVSFETAATHFGFVVIGNVFVSWCSFRVIQQMKLFFVLYLFEHSSFCMPIPYLSFLYIMHALPQALATSKVI